MISHIFLIYIYNSFRYEDIFYDCFIMLFEFNFDFDDFSFEFGNDV